VVEHDFGWRDAGWAGLPLEDLVFYEVHVGTFTAEGTFEALIPHLGGLRELGVTAIELMPVAQFPGTRNWGYDGVYPFAVQGSYGGPDGLRKLVDACHGRGLAVFLDAVYNHLGPEGNYLREFGHYFTDRYRTPWGEAVNFDGPDSDEVRRYFIENARSWIEDFHIDGLRLDAIHAIRDFSAQPFLGELAAVVGKSAAGLNRRVYLVAESNLNDVRVVRAAEQGGLGLDAQWTDDFHHALHVLLTGERTGYYTDFSGLEDLATAYRQGYVYTGQFSAFRRRRHGSSPRGLPARRHVVCAQNHDQVGNRLGGERLASQVSFEDSKLAAAAVLLSPFLPLLFMGEEYGETAPFPYFVSHGDPDLVEAVRAGRRAEFASFDWAAEPPDPQADATFGSALLQRARRDEPRGRALVEIHRRLLTLRKTLRAFAGADGEPPEVTAFPAACALFVRRGSGLEEAFLAFNFADADVALPAPVPAASWRKRFDSSDPAWLGPGQGPPDLLDTRRDATVALPPKTVVVYTREDD
jgi:maltooligosyltrehalose trehalohydrolase